MNGTAAYRVRTFEYPGVTVRAHIPVLPAEEREKRMERIHKKAANLLRKVK